MSEPIFKLIKNPITGQEDSVIRIWDDGKCESHLIIAEAYLKWVAEGNTPEPADEPN
jgi:hypothetical protein